MGLSACDTSSASCINYSVDGIAFSHNMAMSEDSILTIAANFRVRRR